MRDQGAATRTATDAPSARKARGAFFTPDAIAEFLAAWAVRTADSSVLDPTCGESVFLLAAGQRLRELGTDSDQLARQLFGIDLHGASLRASGSMLEAEGLAATLIEDNIFRVPTPDRPACPLSFVDAVVGNPPFVRYQEHRGDDRRSSAEAALRQGVRLSGLASSWASVVIHASGFLKPEGRLAMVLPAELLTVHYAEPVRRWLRERFSGVTLVMFDRLQFDDALEKVVLVLAHGSGGCESFSLVYVDDAQDLEKLMFGDAITVMPASEGKWTDLLLPMRDRRLFRSVVERNFTPLETYGSPTLGTVTGGNDFFALSEATREHYGIEEHQLRKMCPPGTRHLQGLGFGAADWRHLRDNGDRVWMFCPEADDDSSQVERYVKFGKAQGFDQAYKCRIRTPWWRPPRAAPPDLFFTYMSHRYPRLVSNSAGVTFVNSMHGIKLRPGSGVAKQALPLLVLNSVTMLGAEVHGRSYGGGILKMEPREAAGLPVPDAESLARAWEILKSERDHLDRRLRKGMWVEVVKRVDQVLLHDVLGLDADKVGQLHGAAQSLRERRMGVSPTV